MCGTYFKGTLNLNKGEITRIYTVIERPRGAREAGVELAEAREGDTRLVYPHVCDTIVQTAFLDRFYSAYRLEGVERERLTLVSGLSG